MLQDKAPTGEKGAEAPVLAEPPSSGAVGEIREILGLSRGLTMGVISGLVVLLAAAAVYCFLSSPPKTITFTSGPVGSVFHTNAFKYAAILARHGIRVKVVPSRGSLENLERLASKTERVEVGFVQGGVTNAGMDRLMSLGSVSIQPLMIFYRGATLDLLSGFAGKRVVIGPEGSGAHALAALLLLTNGVTARGEGAILDWEARPAAEALLAGRVDAVFLMGEDASPQIMRELLRSTNIHLFHFKQAAAYTRRFGFLSVIELPEGAIDFGRDIPPQDVRLLGPTVELAARSSLHPAISDLLIEAAREVHGKATILQHAGDFPAPVEHDLLLSEDAVRFYKSGKTFFYRYLPFWLASLASRIVLVFLPMAVVVVPILRGIPRLYYWRIQTLIHRRYASLLEVERHCLNGGGAGSRVRLLARLDALQEVVDNMKVPPSFADQRFALRGHIDIVRLLVESRCAA